MKNARRTCLALACLAACQLCACSSTRLTYNYLDWVIGWYLDDYLSLNSRQDDFYRQRLDALLQWHRREQLERYSRFIGQLQQDMRGTLSVSLLKERLDTIEGFWRAIMERAAPDCSRLLLWLDREQRQALYAALEEKQQELEKKYRDETAAQRTKRRVEMVRKAIRRFTGRLSGPQEAVLERWAEGLAPTRKLWLENRRLWQRRLRQVLEADEPDEQRNAQLRSLFVEPELLWSAAYRDAFKRNEAATLAMIVQLHATLSSKQRRQLQEELAGLREDCNRLSQQ